MAKGIRSTRSSPAAPRQCAAIEIDRGLRLVSFRPPAEAMTVKLR